MAGIILGGRIRGGLAGAGLGRHNRWDGLAGILLLALAAMGLALPEAAGGEIVAPSGMYDTAADVTIGSLPDPINTDLKIEHTYVSPDANNPLAPSSNNNNVSVGSDLGKSNVIGGGSWSDQEAFKNEVTINDGQVGELDRDAPKGGIGSVYSGLSEQGNTYDNKIIMNGGFVGFELVGGGNGGGSNTYVSNNSVKIYGKKLSDGVGVNVYGGSSRGDADVYRNSVELNGTFTIGNDKNAGDPPLVPVNQPYGDVFGGTSVNGKVYDNHVTVNGSEDAIIKGKVVGGQSDTEVYQNEVIIKGGVIEGSVYGGFAYTGERQVYKNTVTIEGGTINGDVIGGRISSRGESEQDPLITVYYDADAYGNTVNILGGSFSSADTRIYGGYDDAQGKKEGVKNGNTLNTRGAGYAVNTIGGFQNYNFSLSKADLSSSVYSLSGADVDLNKTNIKVNYTDTGSQLAAGSAITLFGRDGFAGAAGTPDSLSLRQGLGVVYNVAMDGGTVRVLGSQAASFTRAISQVQTGGLVIGTLTSSAVIDKGIPAALGVFGPLDSGYQRQSSIQSDSAYARPSSRYESCAPGVFPLGGGNLAVFAAVDGGYSRFNTGYGSKMAVKHTSLLTGLGWRGDAGSGRLLLGGFLEGGMGNYDSKLGGVKYANDDNFHNLGGGLLARYDLVNGVYAEAEGHLGRGLMSFNANDWDTGTFVSFKSKSTYYGVSVGGGYQFEVSRIKLDLNLHYFWNGANSRDLLLLGQPFNLGMVNSHRLKVGGRGYFPAGKLAPFAGAFFEYEFNGKSNGSVFANELRETRLKGATGIAEIGVRYAAGRFNAELGAKGYVGKRLGVSANLGVGFSF